MNFHVGEKVVYPNHGLGVVETIEPRPTPTGKIDGYGLRILANDSRVWVPQNGAEEVGLRPIVSCREVRRIFDLLGDESVDQSSNWKGRFKENSDKMRTGSLYEVAVVLKGLSYLGRRKGLSFREKRMLDRAKFLLVSEIAEADSKSATNVEDRIEKALTRAFGAPQIRDTDERPIQRPVGLSRRADA